MTTSDGELVKEVREALGARYVKEWPGEADVSAMLRGNGLIVTKAPAWLNALCGAVDRLTAQLAGARDERDDATKAQSELANNYRALLAENRELTAALEVAREDGDRLKRWLADSSAHAQEAVKVIDALKGERDRLRGALDAFVRHASHGQTIDGRYISQLPPRTYMGADQNCAANYQAVIELARAALASHTEPPTQEVEKS